jgi:flagellar motor switch protein FliG
MIKEDLEAMGPTKLKDVEKAQQGIVDIVRKLEEEGKIVISGGGGGDQLV